MAQIRGSWFPHVRTALDRKGVLADVTTALAISSRKILESADPTVWYDEGHAVSVYECVAAARDLEICREVGRDAARLAMSSTWRELMAPLEGLLGATPRMAFEQLPVLWNALRRDGGTLRCSESSSRHAVTEVRGFPYAASAAWVAVFVGHHEALLRHLRFTGRATVEATDERAGLVRLRTVWGDERPPSSK